jgi:hypothetical protein
MFFAYLPTVFFSLLPQFFTVGPLFCSFDGQMTFYLFLFLCCLIMLILIRDEFQIHSKKRKREIHKRMCNFDRYTE